MRRLVLALCLLVLVLAGGCRAATQAQVSLHTNVEGNPGRSVAVWAAGAPLGLESSVPVTYVDAPWSDAGDLGSLTLVPPSVERSRVAVVSALGIGVPPEWCATHEGDGRCIVARRTFRYEPNRGLRIPVGLYRSCLGVRCDASSTCNYEGRCVSADLDTANCSSEVGCILPGDPPVPPGVSKDPVVPRPVPLPNEPPPSPLAPGLSYVDQDPARGLTSGLLQLTRSPEESRVTEYQVHWANAQGAPMQLFTRWSPAQTDLALRVLPGTVVPAGAERFVAMALGPAGVATSASVRADNFARERPLFLETGADLLLGPAGAWDTTGPAPMLTVVATNVSGRATVRRCAADGSNCTRRDLGSTMRYGGAPAPALTAVLGGRLHILEGGADGIRLYRCAQDGTGCTEHDLGSDGLMEFSTGMVMDSARDRFFALSTQVDPSFSVVRVALRRCDASGNNCTRMVLPLSGRAQGRLELLKATGDLVVPYLDGTKGNQLFVATCRPDGSACERFATGPKPTGTPCALSSALAPGEDVLYLAAYRGDCGLATAPLALLTYRCMLATQTCEERAIGAAGAITPHLVVDAPRSRVLVGYGQWISPVNVAHGVHVCDLNLANCVTRSLAAPSTSDIGSGADPFVLLDADGNISMLTRNAQTGGAAQLTRCNVSGQACVYASLADTSSRLSLGTNGSALTLAVDHTGALILGAAGGGADAFRSAQLHRCQDDGTCTLLAQVPQTLFTAAAAWPSRNTALLVSAGAAPLSLTSCPTSGLGCTKQDIVTTPGSSIGRSVVILPAPSGQTVDVVGYGEIDAPAERPWLATCSANGGSCTLRDVAAEAGLGPGHFMGMHAARVGEQVWVTGVFGGQVTLLRCATGTPGCTSEALGPLAVPPKDRQRYTTSLVPGVVDTRVLVGTPEGVRHFSCQGQSPCTSRPTLGKPSWPGEAYPLGAARDPLGGALYVARLESTRKVIFTSSVSLLVSNLVVDRCDDSGCVRVAERSDATALEQLLLYTYADGAPFFYGRPPAVVFDAARRRVLVGVTAAGDLFRPLVLEFDAF